MAIFCCAEVPQCPRLKHWVECLDAGPFSKTSFGFPNKGKVGGVCSGSILVGRGRAGSPASGSAKVSPKLAPTEQTSQGFSSGAEGCWWDPSLQTQFSISQTKLQVFLAILTEHTDSIYFLTHSFPPFSTLLSCSQNSLLASLRKEKKKKT